MPTATPYLLVIIWSIGEWVAICSILDRAGFSSQVLPQLGIEPGTSSFLMSIGLQGQCLSN